MIDRRRSSPASWSFSTAGRWCIGQRSLSAYNLPVGADRVRVSPRCGRLPANGGGRRREVTKRRRQSPPVAERAGAGVGGGVRGKFAVELGEQRDAVGEAKLGAGGGQCRVLRRGGAVDDEARPRQRLEHG